MFQMSEKKKLESEAAAALAAKNRKLKLLQKIVNEESDMEVDRETLSLRSRTKTTGRWEHFKQCLPPARERYGYL